MADSLESGNELLYSVRGSEFLSNFCLLMFLLRNQDEKQRFSNRFIKEQPHIAKLTRQG